MRVVFTGGGTAGHIIPNLAVIEELRKKPDIDILYIGSKNSIEKNLIEKAGIRFEGVYCGKFRRYFCLENFLDVFKIPIGIIQAKRILKEFSPDVVFAKGGYVSVPAVIAAKKLRIPVIIHESDVSPGLANKICFRYANKICISFEETNSYIPKRFENKVIFTGNPVRESILKGNVEEGHKFTGLNHHKPVILILGGSLGAQQINELVRASLDELTKKYQIIHLVGKGNVDIGIQNTGYVQYEYLDEPLKDVYAMCKMVICRGGASTLSELAMLKKKVLIIPICSKATRGEQANNARYFVRKFGWSMISGDITREDFIDNVNLTYRNEMNRDLKFKNGAEEIVKLIFKESK